MSARGWFQVDHAGLADLARRRGISFIVTEPVQNAWDEPITEVSLTLTPVPNSPRVDIEVKDDAPDGFRDLADSYMMFRPSYKLDDPEQRGRFNLGEKLLLSVADEARVVSTTGTVIFGPKGRTRSPKRTEAGSVLTARLRMTRAEMADALAIARSLIAPAGISTIVNGEALPARRPVASTDATLETEVRAEAGGFKYVTRTTTVTVYEALPGESPHLYEMGIPIDELSCPWHVNVGQKVPLSVDRGSVRYGYLKKIEAMAATAMATAMTEEQAAESWVSGALAVMTDDEAIRAVVKTRFGKAVTYDPSSPESNKLALDAGYRVVHGAELSKQAWVAVKRAEALRPAGKVFSTGDAFKVPGLPSVPGAGGVIARTKWTDEMEAVATYTQMLMEYLTGQVLPVVFFTNPHPTDVARRVTGWEFLPVACGSGVAVTFNLTAPEIKRAVEYLEQSVIDEVVLHEAAHVKVKDHLTHAYHRECCRLGSKLRQYLTYLWELK